MKHLKLTYIFTLIWLTSCNDQPKTISGLTETIEVSYVNWACDCADFIERKYFENDSNYEIRAEDCIFIEPATTEAKIPEDYYAEGHFKYYLRLSGQFYSDKGIPKTYERKTPEIPEKARVFRYDKFELVEKQQSAKTIDRDLDALVFGKYCAECSFNCATMYKFYIIGNTQTFWLEKSDDFFKNYEPVEFKTKLTDEKYFKVGLEILNLIPEEILTTDKETQKFGCPDCTDGCGLYFETIKNGQKKKFYIDYQTEELTGEIKTFAELLKTKINDLGR